MRNIVLIFLLVGLISCFDYNDSIEEPPVGFGSEEPSLITTDYGLVMSWMQPIEGDIHLRFSVFNGVMWSEPKSIAKGTNWFVNWADFPALISNGDKLFAHYLQMSGDNTYDYDIMYTISNDKGATWLPPQKLHSDSVKGEHGFLSGSAHKDGFVVSWLDGRYTKLENGAMSLRGAVIDGSGTVTIDNEIDNKTCDCCQTTLANVGGSKPIVFYRDRTDEEIRDISYSVLLDSGWTEPKVFHDDNWEINACPVNGPVTDSDGNNIAVAWFSGKEANHEVKLKISTHGGEAFGEAILVDGPESFGRVDLEMKDNRIYLTYLSRNEMKASLVLAVYDYSGELILKTRLSTLNPERGTGFPRTALWKDKLIITWTDVEISMPKVLVYPINGALKIGQVTIQ